MSCRNCHWHVLQKLSLPCLAEAVSAMQIHQALEVDMACAADKILVSGTNLGTASTISTGPGILTSMENGDRKKMGVFSS